MDKHAAAKQTAEVPAKRELDLAARRALREARTRLESRLQGVTFTVVVDGNEMEVVPVEAVRRAISDPRA
jgi:hypothetical protein